MPNRKSLIGIIQRTTLFQLSGIFLPSPPKKIKINEIYILKFISISINIIIQVIVIEFIFFLWVMGFIYLFAQKKNSRNSFVNPKCQFVF